MGCNASHAPPPAAPPARRRRPRWLHSCEDGPHRGACHDRCEREGGQGARRLLRRPRQEIRDDQTRIQIMTAMKTFLPRLLLVISALFLAAATARAEDLNAVKARIAERLPKLDALKSSGAIGENN